MYHVWLPGATTPVVFEDSGLKDAYLAQQPSGTPMVVREYDVRIKRVTVYNVPGGDPLPQPSATPPQMSAVAYQHMQRKQG